MTPGNRQDFAVVLIPTGVILADRRKVCKLLPPFLGKGFFHDKYR